MLQKRLKNEKWSTIAKREARNDLLLGLLALPLGILTFFLMCAL